MKSLNRGAAILAVLIGLSGAAVAQEGLAVPGAPVARDFPGAKELPDPSLTYKILFDVGKAAKVDEVSPVLVAVGRLVNTLAKGGVPMDHRKIAVVFHRGGTFASLNNDEYKKRNDGHDNPNIALMQSLKKAGVDFRLCGQSALANKIDPKMLQPEVELDLWAMVTMANLTARGYVHFGVE